MKFRQATINDSESISSLHARSWQQTYRGILQNKYLDEAVLVEKQYEWKHRLTNITEMNIWVLLAESGAELRGFSCLFFDYGYEGETYLDNLHIDPDFQSLGHGKALLYKSLNHAWLKYPSRSFYLWVFEDNESAINFYLHHGACIIGDEIQDAPGGGTVKALKMSWNDLAAFANC